MAASLLVATAAAGHSPPRQTGRQLATPVFYPDDPVWVDPDTQDIERPSEQDVDHLTHAIKAVLDPPEVEARIAMNINTLGEVPDSSWFTNRHGRHKMSTDGLTRGPDRGGPPTPGRWTVVDHPGAGYTPKLTIEDADGRRFLLKFELADTPGMRSAAEVICTKFFHAFGYNVPENYVVVFDPGDLVGGDELDPEELPGLDLEDLLADVARTPDGNIRAMASAWLPGEPVGEQRYDGTRPDDPNDVFPHQHRRELRGLRVFSAWLNHTDIKPDNTLDMYVEADGRRFIRHYMIDFGSCMGSGATGPKDRSLGHERYLAPGPMLKGVLTLGLWIPTWSRIDYPEYPSVGNFEAEVYEPWLWRPPIPTASLMHLDAADAFWAARIAARFDDRMVAELVATGRHDDPRQEAYVVETLVRRRDKSVAYWLTRTSPLDAFEVETGTGGHRLIWENAAIRHGAATPGAIYRVRWSRFDNETGRQSPLEGPMLGGDGGIEGTMVELPEDPWGPPDRFGWRFAVAEVVTLHADFPHWSRPVVVTLRQGVAGVPEVVGIRRPLEIPPEPAN